MSNHFLNWEMLFEQNFGRHREGLLLKKVKDENQP